MDIQGGSRKRQRIDAAAADGFQGDSNDKPIVRDNEYYREDGDCVILVGRVLFKIHRFLLERDPSAFSNMFSMPQGNAKCQGNADEDPLVLSDDVSDFRALCWIIYALPAVCLKQYEFATADIRKLVSLYLIAQKYHFDSHEIFARELLQKHCVVIEERPWMDRIHGFYFRNCEQSRLESLLRIARLEDDALTKGSFPDVLQKIWLHRLNVTKESTSFAFEVGEALGLRNFLAGLYYLQLERMKPERIEGSNAYTHADDDLAPHQKLALYRGYWSLRCYWPEARETFLSEEFACSSPRQHACRRIWKRNWEIVNCHVAEHSSAFDPLLELKVVRGKIIDPDDGEADPHVPCAKEAIEKMLNEVIDSLADHFLGPPP